MNVIKCFFFPKGIYKTSSNIYTIQTKTFEKFYKKLEKLNFWAILSMFDAEAQLGALKILKSRRTKVVFNEFPHLLRLQASSILAFEFSPYKIDPAYHGKLNIRDCAEMMQIFNFNHQVHVFLGPLIEFTVRLTEIPRTYLSGIPLHFTILINFPTKLQRDSFGIPQPKKSSNYRKKYFTIATNKPINNCISQ
jgi:hypothetical protein